MHSRLRFRLEERNRNSVANAPGACGQDFSASRIESTILGLVVIAISAASKKMMPVLMSRASSAILCVFSKKYIEKERNSHAIVGGRSKKEQDVATPNSEAMCRPEIHPNKLFRLKYLRTE